MMYTIDRNNNRISELKQKTFSELAFKEREHLQEWIANKPDVFGEELLIIQKEFAGFDDTKERLDLLALDKQGNLVIIENKLDDSGRDVTWQSMKYASYCSTLSKDNIKNMYQEYLDKYSSGEKAEENIANFLEDADEYEQVILNSGFTQRIILVASKFRKEVTSTVLWLANYKLNIQCFKTTPYLLDDRLLINFEQIIPVKDAEEYMIGMAEKNQNDLQITRFAKQTNSTRIEFWKRLLNEFNKKSDLFQNMSPKPQRYLGTRNKINITGARYTFATANSYCRVEIYFENKDATVNKQNFNKLFSKKEEIEKIFGAPLVWERLDGTQVCRIKYEKPYNISDKDQWDEIIQFLVNAMIRLEKAFKNYVN